MEEVNGKWSSLPAEILTKIFQLVFEEELNFELCDFALVCKAWLHSTQLVLYSNISINSLPHLQKFYDIIENNAYLGEIVKHIDLYIPILEADDANTQKATKLEVYNFLTPLLTSLPNLEEFGEYTLYSYTSVLDALLDNGLQKLKVLAVPESNCEKNEVANYITCALLMKDRLENLLVSDNFSFEEQISMGKEYFNRLYNKLDQFDELNTICIHKKTNDVIQVLEHIVGTCKSLKDITLNCRPSNSISSQSNNVSIDEVSNLIPSTSTKSLRIRLESSNDHKLLLYIMHKFPQLQLLTLKMKADTFSVHQLDHQILTRLLNYLSKIESYFVDNIKVDNMNIADFIGAYWKATSEPGSKCVEFITKKTNFEGTQLLFDFSKQTGSSITSISFKYYVSQLDWKYINTFLNKNGKFVRELRLGFEAGVMVILSESFIQTTFTCCPNIQRLELQHCSLQRVAPYSNVDFSKRLSIDELYLDDCNLYPGVLERWSLFLPEIKQLRLKDNYFVKGPQNANPNSPSIHPFFVIAMPNTKIDLIVFENRSKEPTALKVFVITLGTHFYYQYHPSGNENISTITEQEYTNINNSNCVYICCQTKPDFLFQM